MTHATSRHIMKGCTFNAVTNISLVQLTLLMRNKIVEISFYRFKCFRVPSIFFGWKQYSCFFPESLVHRIAMVTDLMKPLKLRCGHER